MRRDRVKEIIFVIGRKFARKMGRIRIIIVIVVSGFWFLGPMRVVAFSVELTKSLVPGCLWKSWKCLGWMGSFVVPCCRPVC
jgi:hypothetical protein